MIRLMIKTHKVTGLKYLCVSQKDKFDDYPGSGVYWNRHLKTHGKEFWTKVLCESNTKDEKFINRCLFYSSLYDIIKSKEWANLVKENGNTSKFNKKSSEETCKRISEGLKKFYSSEDSNKTREALSLITKEKWNDEDHRNYRMKKMLSSVTPERRKKMSENVKRVREEKTTEELKVWGDNISKGKLNMTEEDKLKRKNRIIESLKTSKKYEEYVERMKTERIGGGNPAAVKVHWKGKIFGSRKQFNEYAILKELPLGRCNEILEDESILDCFLEGQSKDKPVITCPHCGKKSKGKKHSTMKRYHFENCKFKEN